MDRTLRAAMLATVLIGVTVAGLGVFLGFEVRASVIAAVIAGGLAGALLVGAARRADTFHPTDPNAHLTDHGSGSTDVTETAADERHDDDPTGA